MNHPQRRFLAFWGIALVAILIIGIFDEWILRHWAILWLPALALIALVSALRKDAVSYAEGRELTLEIIEQHPIIKLWLVVYTLCIAVMLFVVLSKDIKLREYVGPFELLLLLLPIFGPVWFVTERNKYRALGQSKNNYRDRAGLE